MWTPLQFHKKIIVASGKGSSWHFDWLQMQLAFKVFIVVYASCPSTHSTSPWKTKDDVCAAWLCCYSKCLCTSLKRRRNIEWLGFENIQFNRNSLSCAGFVCFVGLVFFGFFLVVVLWVFFMYQYGARQYRALKSWSWSCHFFCCCYNTWSPFQRISGGVCSALCPNPSLSTQQGPQAPSAPLKGAIGVRYSLGHSSKHLHRGCSLAWSIRCGWDVLLEIQV